jgi:hypothetical protein
MNAIETIELLKDPDVIREIHRHLWLESEKAGYDVGLEWAAEDWMNRHAQAWTDCHMPGQEIPAPKTLVELPSAKTMNAPCRSSEKPEPTAKVKKRRAKSYINF